MSKSGRFTTTRGAERGDPALALCSADARLLWFELRLLMAESSEPGFLLVEGARPTPAQIAALTDLDTAQVKISLRELESRGVFSRDKRGVVYCREIIRLEKARANGRRGGNPDLLALRDGAHREVIQGGAVIYPPRAPRPMRPRRNAL